MQKFLLSLLLMPLVMFAAAPAYTQDVDDDMIISRVSRAITNNEELKGAQINVTSVNGYVLLTGQALNADQKQQASIAVAFATNDMRRLMNEIEINAAIDNSFVETDADLLARIESRTANIAQNSAIIVYNGVVHLLGQVKRAEGDAVASEISRIQGVKNIRLSYEYIQ